MLLLVLKAPLQVRARIEKDWFGTERRRVSEVSKYGWLVWSVL